MDPLKTPAESRQLRSAAEVAKFSVFPVTLDRKGILR